MRRRGRRPAGQRAVLGRHGLDHRLVRAEPGLVAAGQRGAVVVQGLTARLGDLPRAVRVHDPVPERLDVDGGALPDEDTGGATGELQRGDLPVGVDGADPRPGDERGQRQDRPDRDRGLQPGRHPAPRHQPGPVGDAVGLLHLLVGVGGGAERRHPAVVVE